MNKSNDDNDASGNNGLVMQNESATDNEESDSASTTDPSSSSTMSENGNERTGSTATSAVVDTKKKERAKTTKSNTKANAININNNNNNSNNNSTTSSSISTVSTAATTSSSSSSASASSSSVSSSSSSMTTVTQFSVQRTDCLRMKISAIRPNVNNNINTNNNNNNNTGVNTATTTTAATLNNATNNCTTTQQIPAESVVGAATSLSLTPTTTTAATATQKPTSSNVAVANQKTRKFNKIKQQQQHDDKNDAHLNTNDVSSTTSTSTATITTTAAATTTPSNIKPSKAKHHHQLDKISGGSSLLLAAAALPIAGPCLSDDATESGCSDRNITINTTKAKALVSPNTNRVKRKKAQSKGNDPKKSNKNKATHRHHHHHQNNTTSSAAGAAISPFVSSDSEDDAPLKQYQRVPRLRLTAIQPRSAVDNNEASSLLGKAALASPGGGAGGGVADILKTSQSSKLSAEMPLTFTSSLLAPAAGSSDHQIGLSSSDNELPDLVNAAIKRVESDSDADDTDNDTDDGEYATSTRSASDKGTCKARGGGSAAAASNSTNKAHASRRSYRKERLPQYQSTLLQDYMEKTTQMLGQSGGDATKPSVTTTASATTTSITTTATTTTTTVIKPTKDSLDGDAANASTTLQQKRIAELLLNSNSRSDSNCSSSAGAGHTKKRRGRPKKINDPPLNRLVETVRVAAAAASPKKPSPSQMSPSQRHKSRRLPQENSDKSLAGVGAINAPAKAADGAKPKIDIAYLDKRMYAATERVLYPPPRNKRRQSTASMGGGGVLAAAQQPSSSSSLASGTLLKQSGAGNSTGTSKEEATPAQIDPVWRKIDVNKKFRCFRMSGYKSDGGGGNTTVCSKILAAKSGYVSDYGSAIHARSAGQRHHHGHNSGYKSDASGKSRYSTKSCASRRSRAKSCGYRSDCKESSRGGGSVLKSTKFRRKRRNTCTGSALMRSTLSRPLAGVGNPNDEQDILQLADLSLGQSSEDSNEYVCKPNLDNLPTTSVSKKYGEINRYIATGEYFGGRGGSGSGGGATGSSGLSLLMGQQHTQHQQQQQQQQQTFASLSAKNAIYDNVNANDDLSLDGFTFQGKLQLQPHRKASIASEITKDLLNTHNKVHNSAANGGGVSSSGGGLTGGSRKGIKSRRSSVASYCSSYHSGMSRVKRRRRKRMSRSSLNRTGVIDSKLQTDIEIITNTFGSLCLIYAAAGCGSSAGFGGSEKSSDRGTISGNGKERDKDKQQHFQLDANAQATPSSSSSLLSKSSGGLLSTTGLGATMLGATSTSATLAAATATTTKREGRDKRALKKRKMSENLDFASLSANAGALLSSAGGGSVGGSGKRRHKKANNNSSPDDHKLPLKKRHYLLTPGEKSTEAAAAAAVAAKLFANNAEVWAAAAAVAKSSASTKSQYQFASAAGGGSSASSATAANGVGSVLGGVGGSGGVTFGTATATGSGKSVKTGLTPKKRHLLQNTLQEDVSNASGSAASFKGSNSSPLRIVVDTNSISGGKLLDISPISLNSLKQQAASESSASSHKKRAGAKAANGDEPKLTATSTAAAAMSTTMSSSKRSLPPQLDSENSSCPPPGVFEPSVELEIQIPPIAKLTEAVAIITKSEVDSPLLHDFKHFQATATKSEATRGGGGVVETLLNKTGAHLTKRKRKKINRTGFPTVRRKKPKNENVLLDITPGGALLPKPVAAAVPKLNSVRTTAAAKGTRSSALAEQPCDRVPQAGETSDTFLERANRTPRVSVVALERLQGTPPHVALSHALGLASPAPASPGIASGKGRRRQTTSRKSKERLNSPLRSNAFVPVAEPLSSANQPPLYKTSKRGNLIRTEAAVADDVVAAKRTARSTRGRKSKVPPYASDILCEETNGRSSGGGSKVRNASASTEPPAKIVKRSGSIVKSSAKCVETPPPPTTPSTTTTTASFTKSTMQKIITAKTLESKVKLPHGIDPNTNFSCKIRLKRGATTSAALREPTSKKSRTATALPPAPVDLPPTSEELDLQAAAKDSSIDEIEHDVLPLSEANFDSETSSDTNDDKTTTGKRSARPKKTYLVAGLFSNYYKTDQPPTSNKKAVVDKKDSGKDATTDSGANCVLPLLPPPPYCERYLRRTQCDFLLPYDIWLAIKNSKLPSRVSVPSWNYRKIRTNVYAESVRPNTAGLDHPTCNCKRDVGCGDNCLNRMVYTECSPSNCPCRDKCRNQKIQRHEVAPGVERFMTENKGWGVRTKLPIKRGTYILEYVGEVVTEREFKDRMGSLYNNDTHHYCLHLDGGLVIDGHRMGSDGRFVNHSCEPNCEMQKWSVNGLSRMALFAKRQINEGEELTYDYNFSLFNPSEGQPCRCNTANCRGVIGGKSQRVKPLPMDAKTTDVLSKENRNGRQRKRTAKKNAQRLQTKDVIVTRGVQQLSDKEKKLIKQHSVFLLRNFEKVCRIRSKKKTGSTDCQDPAITALSPSSPQSNATGGVSVNTTTNGAAAAASSTTSSALSIRRPPTPSTTLAAQILALCSPRHMKTRGLTMAVQDPELERMAKIAVILREICTELESIKGDSHAESLVALALTPTPLNTDATSTVSGKKKKSGKPLKQEANDLKTVQTNIEQGYYKEPNEFDEAMRKLFAEARLSLPSQRDPAVKEKALTDLEEAYEAKKQAVYAELLNLVNGVDVLSSFRPKDLANELGEGGESEQPKQAEDETRDGEVTAAVTAVTEAQLAVDETENRVMPVVDEQTKETDNGTTETLQKDATKMPDEIAKVVDKVVENDIGLVGPEAEGTSNAADTSIKQSDVEVGEEANKDAIAQQQGVNESCSGGGGGGDGNATDTKPAEELNAKQDAAQVSSDHQLPPAETATTQVTDTTDAAKEIPPESNETIAVENSDTTPPKEEPTNSAITTTESTASAAATLTPSNASIPSPTLTNNNNNNNNNNDKSKNKEQSSLPAPSAAQSSHSPTEDIIGCICGLYKDEGVMIQCARCMVWQHTECTKADVDAEKYLCERCEPRTVDREIPLDEYTDEGHRYYLTLMRGDLHVRQGDAVYVLRDIPIKDASGNVVPSKKHTYETIGDIDYNECDIFRVERLWKNKEGKRFIFGHHFLRPHETFHEPSRRFYPNEVVRVPLYEVVPIELVIGRCWVLDRTTFCKGRPIECGDDDEHCYICELRVDKSARFFSKAKVNYPTCTKSYAFRKFAEKLKISKSYAPHDVDPSMLKSKKQQSSTAKTDSDALSTSAATSGGVGDTATGGTTNARSAGEKPLSRNSPAARTTSPQVLKAKRTNLENVLKVLKAQSKEYTATAKASTPSSAKSADLSYLLSGRGARQRKP